MNINWVPDGIPVSLRSWLCMCKDLIFPQTNLPSMIVCDGYSTIYGYSCRSLFELWMQTNKTADIKYAITPIHHTSWRDIIQKYINDDQITILELNDTKSALQITGMEELTLAQVKVVIVTHLFGLDFDLSVLEEYKKKYNWLVVEDRVQGGTLKTPFSHSVVDIAFYSMGMDKRPCALGGGFVNIRKGKENIRDELLNALNKLPPETLSSRCWGLIQKIPTYALYTYRPVYRLVRYMLPWFGVNLADAVQRYRKNNPGFSHHNYLLKPHPALQTSMYRHNLNYQEIETRLRFKFNFFYQSLNLEYIPWINNKRMENKYSGKNISLTMYNTIFLKPEKKEEKLVLLENLNVAYLPNPTWKVLQVAPPTYQEFCDGLVYLPCLYHMTPSEMVYLSSIINSN